MNKMQFVADDRHDGDSYLQFVIKLLHELLSFFAFKYLLSILKSLEVALRNNVVIEGVTCQ